MTTQTLPQAPTVQPWGCDRCPAAGAYHWRLPDGLDLVLCGHHSRQHGPALITSGGIDRKIDATDL